MSSFMPSDHDLRTSLIFCYHLKKNAAESHPMLVKAYGGNALSDAQCYRWFEKFQSGYFNVRNEERGRPAKKMKIMNCKHHSMKMMTKHARISCRTIEC
ncbi:mariner Mos1 transposase [Trichonephila clavipes]|nr:mariner Mos1 transposase [Trichonephila clavipes]